MKKRCKWIEALSAIAAIITALTSAWTLWVNVVERREVSDLQSKSKAQDTVLSNAIERVSLYGDIIAAEGGDRWAYKRAKECLLSRMSQRYEDATPLLQKLEFSMHRFTGEMKGNPTLEYALMGPASESIKAQVENMLKRDDSFQRLCALKHILWLRLNKHIPLVVEMLQNEPDLNVVQYALHVVSKTFTDNMIPNDTTPIYALTVDDCVFRHDEFKRHFEEMWKPAKDRILARKPKEVKEGRDKKPPHLPMVYLFDPEKPTDIPVIKE